MARPQTAWGSKRNGFLRKRSPQLRSQAGAAAMQYSILLHVFLLSIISTTWAASGGPGRGLVLLDYKTWIVSDLIERSPDAISVGVWVKNVFYTDCEFLFFCPDATEGLNFNLNWYSQVPAIELNLAGFRMYPPNEDDIVSDTEWFHIGITWRKSDNRAQIYLNARLVAEDFTPAGFNLFPDNGRFYVARPFTLNWQDRPQVMIDQMFVLNRTIDAAEMTSLMSGPPTPSFASNLILYWDFEDISPISPYHVMGSYGTAIRGRVVESPGNLLAGIYGPAIEPTRAVSEANFHDSGYLVVKQNVSGTVRILLEGSRLETPQVESLPTYGELRLLTAAGFSGSVVSTVPTTAPYGVEYTGTWATDDSFQYSIGGNAASVLLVTNRAPSPLNHLDVWVDQNTDFELYLTRKFYYPPGSKKAFDWVQVDGDGDTLSCTVWSYPSSGELQSITYSQNGHDVFYTLVSRDQIPYVSTDCIILYSPPSGEYGDNFTSLNVSVSDGIASAWTTLRIHVVNHFYPPRPSNIVIPTMENTNATILFQEANKTDTFDSVAGGGTVIDSVWVEIDEFPKNGRLFQLGSTAEILGSSNPQVRVSSWVTRVVEVSSEYVDPSGWGRMELLGPNDCFPSYGDNPRAWQTEFTNSDGWIIVEFANLVFPDKLDIYQTWYSGTIFRISVQNPQTGQFVIVWQIEPSLIQTLDAAQIFSPPLCPVSFMTKVVKIEFLKAGSNTYVEIDAVQLWGFENQPKLNMVDTKFSSIVYSPRIYTYGNDTVRFHLNRCINYARFRDGYTSSANVTVVVPKINHVPFLPSARRLLDISSTSISNARPTDYVFHLEVLDVDSDPVQVKFQNYPSNMRIFVSGAWVSVQKDVLYPADSALQIAPPSCAELDYDTRNETLLLVLTDGEAISSPQSFYISIDCIGNVRRASKAVDIFVFVVSAISVLLGAFFMSLVVIFRQSNSIRSISPAFCAITIAGSICVGVSPIFLTTRLNNCTAWISYLTLGVVLFFSAIGVKTYRVDRIFNTQSLKIFSVTNVELLGYVGLFTTIQVALLVAWHVAIPQSASLVPVTNSVDKHVVQMCFNERWNIVAGVEYTFLILLFAFTAFFAWRVRRIPSEEFKESKEIFMAVYNVGFVSVITVPLASVFWYEPNASAAVTAAGCAFASVASLLVLFAVKFARVLRGVDFSERKPGSDSGTSRPSHSAYSLQSETESIYY